MSTLKNRGILPLLAALALGACAESDGLEPAIDALTPDERAELAVLTDPGSFEVALELTEATADVADGMGLSRGTLGRGLNLQARQRFSAARDFLMAGSDREALAAAREARGLVAEALRELGGDTALEALIERIEALALTATDDVFDDADLVRAELERIAAEARTLLEQGDTLAAAARAILGEQLARYHRGCRDRPDIDVDRARLAVALARSAVALAERLIGSDAVPVVSASDANVTDQRNRWLAYARKLLERAELALANGNRRRAVHFAQHASWSALKAVILPGGIREEELRAIVDVAKTLLGEARAGLGDEPTDLELRLLHHATDLLEKGIVQLEEGRVRGVAAVWRSAVISSWLLR